MPENAEGDQGFISRRGFIRIIAGTIAAACLPACRPEQQALGFRPEPQRNTPFITANDDFFVVAVEPSYRPAFGLDDVAQQWSLELAGVDGDRSRLGYDELSRQANHTVLYTIECIGNPVGGQLIGNAGWRVVPLKKVLARAPGGIGTARSVMFEGLDDFYSSVSIERATDDYAFIAVAMNGVPLPAAHGFPARVLLPDLYGMKQPRWLRRIALSEGADTTSYWEKRGWAGEVPVKTMSRIDPREKLSAGRNAELTGLAYAGVRGIAKVEVSLDDGTSWVDCELVTAKQPDVWSLWRYIWPKPSPGRTRVLVRATDGKGAVQSAERQERYPDGASGYDRLKLTVV